MFLIIDTVARLFVETDFETREEAEARLAELVEQDPTNEGVLRIFSWDEWQGVSAGQPV